MSRIRVTNIKAVRIDESPFSLLKYPEVRKQGFYCKHGQVLVESEPQEPHKTAWNHIHFYASTRSSSAVFAIFVVPEPHRTAGTAKTAGSMST